MAKILVTGATGFVGSSVCRHLHQQGHTVHAVYREYHSNDPYEWVKVPNINGQTNWSETLKEIDYVIHLAARVHVMNEDPSQAADLYQQINRDGTINLAEQASQTGVKRIVFLSSIKVNGENTLPHQPFTADVTHAPIDPYGRSKWEAENALQDIADQKNIETVILRCPLVYGPGVKANFLQLIKLASKGWPVPFGNLTNKRSLIFVENLASALCSTTTHPEAANKIYLVSDQKDLSVTEMYRLMCKYLKQPAKLVPVPIPILLALGFLFGKQNVVSRLSQFLQVDSDKITKDLGWTPPYSVEQGFEKTIQWFNS